MTNRTLLFLSLEKADNALIDSIAAAGWQVEVVNSLISARKKFINKKYSAAFFIAERIDDFSYKDIEEFLKTHNMPEWVGAFSERLIASPHRRELILNHFFDFHTLPIDIERLLHTLGHAHGVYLLRSQLHESTCAQSGDPLIGDSLPMRVLRRDIRKVATVEAPVLIYGPSGSGKELTAHAIHSLSRRTAGPFIAVNCSALPPTLIQSELFGYEKGAFSGANRSKQGYIESAAGGTIFLDEIGDIPIDLQTNLLRFLQEKTINRVGSTQLQHVDTRVIAASHIDLEQAVRDGRFRDDLYYRLNVLPLRVPSLQERREDVLLLAEHFYTLFERERSPRLKGFGAAAIRAMEIYPWPGNVRELLNRVRRAMVMTEGRVITPEDLGLEKPSAAKDAQKLGGARDYAEKSAILKTLSSTGNNVTHAARELGVSRMTLYRLLEKHGIEN